MGACVDITVPRNTSLLRLKLDKFFEDQTSGLEIRDEAKVLSHNNRVDSNFSGCIIKLAVRR